MGSAETEPVYQAKEIVDELNEAYDSVDLDRIRSHVDRLEELAESHPTNPVVSEALAVALLRAAEFEGLVEGEEPMRSRVERLAELAESYPDSERIRAAKLAAGVIAAGTTGEFETMRSRLDRIDDLVETHRDDPGVRLAFGAAVQAAIIHESQAGHRGAVDSHAERLLDVGEDYPDDPNLNRARSAATSALKERSVLPRNPTDLLRDVMQLELGLLVGVTATWAQFSGHTTLAMAVVGLAAGAVLLTAGLTYRKFYAASDAPPNDDWPWYPLVGFGLGGGIGAGLAAVGTAIL